MLSIEEQVEIKVLARQGMSIREISRRLQVSRCAVRHYLRDITATQRTPRKRRRHELDPYRGYIEERLRAAHPAWLAATVLCREIKLLGYEGGMSRVCHFIRGLRVVRPEAPLIRFETPAGQQMQCDWIVFRRGKHTLSAFVSTLSWSRTSFVEFVNNEKLDTLLAYHEHAFEYFGGVPREILYDNMKTVVLERDAYGPGKHRFQPAFLDFANHYGFVPRLCQPYRAKTKGKVERFNGYLRRSFYVPLAAQLRVAGLKLDVITANAEVRRWLAEVANPRIHGTTQVKPAERLNEERLSLQPIPAPWRGELCAARPHLAKRDQPTPRRAVVSQRLEQPTPVQHQLAIYDRLFEQCKPGWEVSV